MSYETKLAKSIHRDYQRDAAVARYVARQNPKEVKSRALLVLGMVLGLGSALVGSLN